MKAYKYKLKPSAKVEAIFIAWLATLCELYNAALQERRDVYHIGHTSIGFEDQVDILCGGLKLCLNIVQDGQRRPLKNPLLLVLRNVEAFNRRDRPVNRT